VPRFGLRRLAELAAGELADDGAISGVSSSEQGGVPVTFRR
jgi:hypothetical protein